MKQALADIFSLTGDSIPVGVMLAVVSLLVITLIGLFMAMGFAGGVFS